MAKDKLFFISQITKSGCRISHTEIGAQSLTAGGWLDIIFGRTVNRSGDGIKTNRNLPYLFKCRRFFLCLVGSEN